jgi:acyl carrier protein
MGDELTKGGGMEERIKEERIKEIIANVLGTKLEDVTKEKRLVDDLGADSLDTLEIVMGIEDAFDIEIPEEEVEELTTVGDVTNYVELKTS